MCEAKPQGPVVHPPAKTLYILLIGLDFPVGLHLLKSLHPHPLKSRLKENQPLIPLSPNAHDPIMLLKMRKSLKLEKTWNSKPS